ncbi:MAG: helix-turn-helix transcriptional regulator [Acidobacteria bacterium]|nr:helix-turn-helix transcriptional regulator [Acidobacteriota bacterium]
MQLINLIGIIAVFVLLLLSLFLLTVRTKNKLSNRLFAVFLILTAINFSGWFLPLFLTGSHDLMMFRTTASFLEMPFFYFYVLSVCFVDFSLKPKHLLHGIPFVFVNLLLLPGFYLTDTPSKTEFLTSSMYLLETQLIIVLGQIQWLFYIVLVLSALNRFKKIYRENYAETSIQIYKWLFQLTILFIVAHTFASTKRLVVYTSYSWAFSWLQIFVGIVALSITCWFVLKAMYSPELFRGVDSRLQTVDDLILQKGTVDNALPKELSDSKENPAIERLESYMKREKPYLDSSLTLQKLAAQIGMTSRDLSILINHELDQHFFDFVNSYRVEEAAGILGDPAKDHLTILEILYEVGFNSKSSFNTAFKKHTNLTPTQYRKTHNLIG